MGKKYIVYYRVSTQKQSLGLDAQRTMVKTFLRDEKEIKSFTEKESGKSDKNRPELQKALEMAKKKKAILLVATLSRLSRDLHFITSLEKSKVNFKVCDMPDATPLTIHIMGAIAQFERQTISNRTKRALAEVRKVKPLGYDNPKVKKGLEKLWEKRRELKEAKKQQGKTQKKKPLKDQSSKREQADKMAFPLIKTLRKQGLTWAAVTEEVNEAGLKSRWDCKWHVTSIKRVAKRNSQEAQENTAQVGLVINQYSRQELKENVEKTALSSVILEKSMP